ncbi:unnamed protein product [Linum trigynum]|uniref:Cytochrome P450 n=1 Tax=Linum trigynum TaxID=586398 RepID=A0AAV2EXU0_9ROSI
MIDNLTASQMLIPMALCLGFLGAALIIFLHNMLLKPLLLQRRLNSLGARGPSYKFFFGNTLEMKKLRQASMAKPMSGLSHDIYPRLQPHLSAWTKTYGRNFTFWFGPRPFLVLSEPNLVKEVAADREKAYRKVELFRWRNSRVQCALISRKQKTQSQRNRQISAADIGVVDLID